MECTTIANMIYVVDIKCFVIGLAITQHKIKDITEVGKPSCKFNTVGKIRKNKMHVFN